ncbi:PIR protein [Plasmodium ovale]|uniref:PIR protein n=1 Tax=Plasmodium ovale TaxID=36330 RepID=A0A1D3JF41_PLAOA|nr:PIR protein [Plasmodium ovale]
METGGLNVDELPSNKHKDELIKKTNFTELEKEGAFDNHEANGIPLLNQLNPMLKLGYHKIKRTCSKDSDPKCCRDINYYLDLVTAFIKKSNYDKEGKKGLINYIEEYWKEIFGKRDYVCTRELDEESVRKRCILKQLYDYCDDKNDIADKEGEYNTYLEKKWLKIIGYTTSTEDDLYFKIEGWNTNQLFNFKDFLLKPQDACSPDYKNVTLSHISLFNEKPVHKVLGERAKASKNADEGRGRGGREQQVPLPPSDEDPIRSEGVRLTTGLEGETLDHVAKLGPEEREVKSSLPLWETPLSAGFSVAGSIFFFFFLYKFSPIGPWINTLIKKDSKGARGMNEDESLLFLNHPEYKDHCISYNSVSH